jgi:Protein of unknown function (DUF2786)
MSSNLTPEMEAVIAKIVKLQNLAANNPNEAEASAASAKASQLLTDYNLDSAVVERAAGGSGKREEAKVEGGFYQWQRELWEAVAEVNFCYYWSQMYRTEPMRKLRKEGYVVVRVRRRRHCLIGRTVNVKATEIMAGYLEGAIERVIEERFPVQDNRDKYIASYREGIAYRIRQRLEERRRDAIEKDLKARNAAKRKAERDGVSTSTALTLSSYVQSEEDANTDFRYGEGTSARWAAARTERAEERRKAQEEYTLWAATHPKEAAAKEAKAAAARRRASYSRSNDRFGKVDDGAFWSGVDAGEKVGLDPQMDGGRAAPRKIGKN